MNRTGYHPHEGPSNSDLLWSFPTEGQVQSSPVVDGGKVYFGSDDDNLYCVDIATGTEQWAFETGNQVLSTPVVCGGLIYVGSSDGNLYAVDPEFGDEVWSYHIEAKYGQIVTSPVVVDGLVYFASDEGAVYALDALTGEEGWRTPGAHEFWASPTVVDGRVLIGGLDGLMLCLDASDGSVLWTYQVGGYEGIYSSAAVVESPADGFPRVLFGSALDDNTLYCLKLADGSLDWKFSPDGPVYASPAVHDGMVFSHAWGVNDTGGNVWALPLVDPTPGDGEILAGESFWHSFTGDLQGGSSPTVADGRVYVGSDGGDGGGLFCFDKTTGAPIWNRTLSGDVYSTPWVEHGLVFVGCNDNCLKVYGGEGDAVMELEMSLEDAVVYSGRSTALNFRVTYRGFPVHGAFISISADKWSEGLAQSGASTFPDGTQRIKWSAPGVEANTTITFKAVAAKAGYPEASASAAVYVIPAPDQGGASSGERTFSLDKYGTLFWAIGILAVANGLLYALIVIGRRKQRAWDAQLRKNKEETERAKEAGTAPKPFRISSLRGGDAP
jgi:outer membrane protein assembly factor BamB